MRSDAAPTAESPHISRFFRALPLPKYRCAAKIRRIFSTNGIENRSMMGKGRGIFKEMTWIWVGMVGIALIFGAATGQSAAVGAAAAQGVQQAITFCLTVGGMICLWSGVM